MNRKPHRQICQLCHHVCRVDFFVPHDIWELSLHRSQLTKLLCLDCFTRLADIRHVEWDKDIELCPISEVRHLREDIDEKTNL